jgi:hypothetical protein
MRPSAYDGEETRRRLVGTARLQDLHHVWGWRARLPAPATERSLGRNTLGFLRSLRISRTLGRLGRGRLAHYITSGPACTGD